MQRQIPPPSSGGSGGLFASASTTKSDDNITASVFNTRTSAPFTSGSKPSDASPLFQQQATAAAGGLLFAQPAAQTNPFFQPSGLSSLADQVPSQPQDSTTPHAHNDVKLTEEELEAFKAKEFVLGKIPEHLPPPHLC